MFLWEKQYSKIDAYEEKQGDTDLLEFISVLWSLTQDDRY